MPTINSLSSPNSFFPLDPIKVVSLFVAKIKQIATAIFSRLAAFFRGHLGRSAGLRRNSEGRQDVIRSNSSSPERLQGKENSQLLAPEGSKEGESQCVNEELGPVGGMAEGIAKGSEKSIFDIIRSLSTYLPPEEEPWEIRVWDVKKELLRIWDVNKDAEAIAPPLKEMHFSEEYSKEELKDLMVAEIKRANRQNLSTLMRCLLALNENWPFFDEMEVLQECISGRRGNLCFSSPYDHVEGNLLIRAIQKNALPEGWIKTICANADFNGWMRFSRWLSFFIRLDEDKINKYAKEFHFSVYFYYRVCLFTNLSSILSAFKENEDKLPLFLSSCEGEIQPEILTFLFDPDSFSERIRKECLDVLFSLNLSKEARGVLMEYLFSNDFRDETEKRNEYLEKLLKQGEDISLLPKQIFLPVEGNEETKKVTVDLLIRIIRNPHIQQPMPIIWLATVMAYVLNLDFSDLHQKDTSLDEDKDSEEEDSYPFGERWNECVTSQRILDLKEEDYSLLEELISILSTTKPILKDALCKDFSLEVRLAILVSVFVGLDKLRMSGIEHFKREQDKKSWSNKIEALMKKITDAIASNMPDLLEKDSHGYPECFYVVIAFLFTNKLNEEQAIFVFQEIEKVDQQLHPLVKPFLSAWGSLDKGERDSSEST